MHREATGDELTDLRRRERIGGTIIAALGLLLAALAWHQASGAGEFSLKASFRGPTFAVIGGGHIVWPGYRTERLVLGRDLGQLNGLELLTRRWWTILIGAILVGVSYTLALSRGWLAPGI